MSETQVTLIFYATNYYAHFCETLSTSNSRRQPNFFGMIDQLLPCVGETHGGYVLFYVLGYINRPEGYHS
jgi:hypothetical protein